MDSNILQQFQSELMCAICMNTFVDPVTTECGHSFCRPCLCLSWEEDHFPARCPLCRQPSQQRDFSTNILLKNMASIARKASFIQFQSLEEHRFKTHKKTKTNRHWLTKEAAEEHRSYVNCHRIITSDIYEMLHPSLQEERRQYSEILLDEGIVVLRQLKKRKIQMMQKKTYLRKLYQDLVKTYQKSDVELFQDVKTILARCKSMLANMLKPMTPQLSAHTIPGLIESLNQYQEKISFNHETQYMDMFGHEQMCSHSFVASYLNFNGSSYVAISGDQVFHSGKHYWELSVGDSLDWALGIYKNCVIGSETTVVDSKDIFLLLCLKNNIDYSIYTTSPTLRHHIEKPRGKIGVFLDLDNGSAACRRLVDVSVQVTYVSKTPLRQRPPCSPSPGSHYACAVLHSPALSHSAYFGSLGDRKLVALS
ncbi:tripartite motif-containing protein 43-like [Thomomys bottae]